MNDTAPIAAPDPSPPPATCGRMIIDLIDNGTSRPTPRITLAPAGRFTPGMMLEYVPLFAQEIERAHAATRTAAAQAATAATSRRRAR